MAAVLTRVLTLCCVLVAAMMNSSEARNREVRGAWVTAWDYGFYTADQADATIKAAKRAGLNTLFIQVRKIADAYYNSSIEPHGSGPAADFDPLAYILKKAHAEGIEVHAWVNVFRVWKSEKSPTDPRHVINRHPEWINKRYDGSRQSEEGLYLDPGIPEVREHTARVVEELARLYDIDGIHLDYIRYPGKDWGYSEAALCRYYAETGEKSKPKPGDAKWSQWRREQVTKTVRLLRVRLKRVKPMIKLTAATIVWGDSPKMFTKSSAYSSVYQDWRAWLAERLIDANVPMNYKSENSTVSAKQFRDWFSGLKTWCGGRPTYVGIGADRNDSSGVLKQIAAVKQAGMGGYVIFPFNDTPSRSALVDALALRISITK